MLIISTAFRVFCFAGALYQVVVMSQLYFRYRVTTQISIKIDEVIEPYAATVCTRVTDILDFDQVNNQTGRNWTHSRNDKMITKYKSEMTVAEMFKFSPPANETVASIRYRKAGSYVLHESKGMSDMESEKFLYSEFICYKLSLKRHLLKPINHKYLSVATSNPGLIYEMTMGRKLANAHYMKILIARASIHPRRSMRFIPMIRRGSRNTTGRFRALVNHISSRVSHIRSQFLPPPYETDCMEYAKKTKYRTQAICEHSCMIDLISQHLHLVTFTSYIMKPMDMKLIIDPDALEKNRTKTFYRIRCVFNS